MSTTADAAVRERSSWIQAAFLVGWALGGGFFGRLGDRLGRKGVLLVGVPGCGKSLCAKAVAMEWKLPLLKLDTGRLYDKYMGRK